MLNRIIKIIKTLYNEKVRRFVYKIKEHWVIYSAMTLTGLYLYGMVVASFRGALHNFVTNTNEKMFTLNPIKWSCGRFYAARLGHSVLYPYNVPAYKAGLAGVHNRREDKEGRA